MSDDDALPLLTIFEVETEEGVKNFVGFVEPVRAGAEGIDDRAIVGEFEAPSPGEFDVESFEPHEGFIAAFVEYMNGDPSRSGKVIEHARTIPGKWLYIVDPRNATDPEQDPPPSDVVGAFAVDDSGQIVPNSFQYNAHHAWFCPDAGPSGLFHDRAFYDWIHQSGA